MRDRYVLRCYACSKTYDDDGIALRCTAEHEPSFLHTEYSQREFVVDEGATGLLRYAAWLPLRERIHDVGRTAILPAEALRAFLPGNNVWIAFNGRWPEQGALLPTATFKDLEAAGILGRFPRDGRTLVTASAGNTAAALARACGEYGVPAVIVAPEPAIARLRFDEALHSCVRFVSIDGDSTYDDAIAFAKGIASEDDAFVFEGGAANVARRDAIATTLLAAVEKLRRLPAYYVQAAGSGAGAIAVHEAAKRLQADGRFGRTLPKVMLVQNAPSTPIVDAWEQRATNEVERLDAQTERAQARSIAATVLSTRIPPYAVAGGLRTILTESGGSATSVTNDDVWAASRAFESAFALLVEPAGAVALAGLRRLLRQGAIDRDAEILVHVTGGRPRADEPRHGVVPVVTVHRRDAHSASAWKAYTVSSATS
ncbi:MAG TPA: cysteate synthase [Candidatus Baltobacteraceae bacterium]|nr:cysteate synthase [Candidatus Baltobacteraceae bacterium]